MIAPRWRTDRPWMPDYGLAPVEAGLLLWSWAEERLDAASRYWISTVDAQGKPHLSAVWAVRVDNTLWFSCGPHSRKARNLGLSGRCAIATERADEAVTMIGVARRVEDVGAGDAGGTGGRVHTIADAYRAKYGESFPDPAVNPLYGVTPDVVIGVVEDPAEFSTWATRWTFHRPETKH